MAVAVAVVAVKIKQVPNYLVNICVFWCNVFCFFLFDGNCEDAPCQSAILTSNVRTFREEGPHARAQF